MKQKILLTLFLASLVIASHAQRKQQKITAYAITAAQKGNSNWTEVRLVDITTGEEVQSVYESKKEIPVLNARTGKPIVKKDINNNFSTAKTEDGKNLLLTERRIVMVKGDRLDPATLVKPSAKERIVIRVNENNKFRDAQSYTIENNNVNNNSNTNTNVTRVNDGNRIIVYKRHVEHLKPVQTDQPFATNSAACAYDKKHDRLYYTPMGINQLRYIDLKSKNSSAHYFEDEPFGALRGRFDVPNQVTRMVIGSDGNGYALTNNGEHLIRFTTNKKAEIKDLGALTDDAENGSFSVRSKNGYGGDMIAGESGSLYLIAANRTVFKIDVKNMTAKYLGSIKGLPRGYSTNGAIADKETSIIVSSAQSTEGYYKFDLKTLQAEKLSTSENVFNASDLANGNLVKDKKKRNDEQPSPQVAQQAVSTTQQGKLDVIDGLNKYKMSVYPNPATNGVVNLLFGDYPRGRYQVQFMDVSGKIFNSQNVTINNKNQVQQFALPQLMGKGNYLVKVVGGEANGVMGIEQLVVQ